MDLDSGWYSDGQLTILRSVAASVVGLSGLCIEVGCWKGNSTITIAQTITDGMICAVDTWQGSVDESPDHDTVKMAQEKDIMSIFRTNMQDAGVGEKIVMFKNDWREFFVRFDKKFKEDGIRFLHIDGSHDYKSVYDNIAAALPYMVKGGVLCGDDIATAHRGRSDLEGGVERAVLELLPGYTQFGNFWYWRKR